MEKSKKQKEKVYNLPNFLTFLRMSMIPVFIYIFIYSPAFPVWFLLLLAFITDFLDGQIARILGEVTEFGIVFDPLVDRLFIFTVLIAYLLRGYLSFFLVLPVLLRDLMIVGGYLFLKSQKISLRVSVLGKTATFLVFTSLVILVFPGLERLGLYVYILGAVVYLYSGLDYFLCALNNWKKRDFSEINRLVGVREVKRWR